MNVILGYFGTRINDDIIVCPGERNKYAVMIVEDKPQCPSSDLYNSNRKGKNRIPLGRY